jgi:hypothetical protein
LESWPKIRVYLQIIVFLIKVSANS